MLEGIDISHWETVSDWPAVKAVGVRFVYLKATQGEKSVDRCFHKYRLACQTVGLAVGCLSFLRLPLSGMPRRSPISSPPSAGRRTNCAACCHRLSTWSPSRSGRMVNENG